MGDSNARRNFISNCMAIMRATKGRGLVVSSGAVGVLGVRPPADVVNLLSVWGLSRDRGTESIGVNPRGVVVNEGIKRSSFRGVIDVVDGGEREVRKEPVVQVKGNTKEKNKKTNGDGDEPTKKIEGLSGTNGKRKPDDNGEGDVAPQISKTQRKKMRLAQMKAEKEAGANTTLSASEPSRTKPQANG